MNIDISTARTFLDAMVPLVEAAERSEAMLRRKLGSAFRIAEYAVRGYEVPLNRIIADLLDPRGPHGQGPTFLKLFLTRLVPDLPINDSQQWRVVPGHRIVVTSQKTRRDRYVDIALFEGASAAAIYIESKPWALEGFEQLRDYAVDLLSRSDKQKRLLFLPGPADRKQQTLTPEIELQLGSRFVTVPFQHREEATSIVRWLEDCTGACEADNVRLFVGDLTNYLDAQFPRQEIRPMSDDPFSSMMIDVVRKNQSYMETVFRLAEVTPQLKETIASSFMQKLRDKLVRLNPNWVVENEFKRFNESCEALSLRRASWPEGWAIRLEMEAKHFRHFCIGLYQAVKDTPSVAEQHKNEIKGALEEPLRAIGDRFSAGGHWIAWCWLPGPFKDWTIETFLLLAELKKMPDESSALTTFVDWFQLLMNALGNKVDNIPTELNQVRSAKPI